MRILKLLLSAFTVTVLMTVFVSCEKNEYVQPDRDVVTQQATGSDRGVNTDDGNCDGHGNRDGGGCGGGG